MPRTRNMVEAREAIVITVGARPPEYEMVEITNRRSGQKVMAPKDEPFDQGDDGVPYAFKEGQKVRRDHPAVKACPGAFIEAGEDTTVA